MGRVIYGWNIYTKEYKGPSIARNKDQNGNYLLPKQATWKEPPKTGENEAARWTGSTWEVVPDYRGKTFYETVPTKEGEYIPHKIHSLGDAPDPTWAEKEPVPFCTWNGKDWELDKDLWIDEAIRPQRNDLLNEVDLVYCNADKWERMSDEKKAEWRAYKQKLRDLPETIDLKNPVFPKMPNEEPLDGSERNVQ